MTTTTSKRGLGWLRWVGYAWVALLLVNGKVLGAAALVAVVEAIMVLRAAHNPTQDASEDSPVDSTSTDDAAP